MTYLSRLMTICLFQFAYFLMPLCATVEEDNDLMFCEGQETLYVSLGADCRVAYQSRLLGLRKSAFPFDWVLSVDTSSITHIISDEFQFFLDEEYFENHPIYSHIMVNRYYGIEFRHEWACDLWNDFFKYKETMDAVRMKNQRRIDRFLALNEYRGKVFFIRIAFNPRLDSLMTGWSKQQLCISHEDAVELRDVLREKFPNLNFKLVLANYVDEMDVPLKIEDVIEYKFTKQTDAEDFQKMLNHLHHVVDKSF